MAIAADELSGALALPTTTILPSAAMATDVGALKPMVNAVRAAPRAPKLASGSPLGRRRATPKTCAAAGESASVVTRTILPSVWSARFTAPIGRRSLVIFPLLPKDESSDPAAKALVAAPRAGAVSPPSGSNPPPHPAEMARTQTIDDGPMTLRENIVRM